MWSSNEQPNYILSLHGHIGQQIIYFNIYVIMYMLFIYFYCYFVFALKRAVYIDVNSSNQMTNRLKNDLLYIVTKLIYLSIIHSLC